MATIKLAHIVSDVKGSIGGTIFGNTRNQLYLRSKTSQINKVSHTQGLQRQFIGRLTQSWRLLAENQRLQWTNFAQNQKSVNRVGGSVQKSGFNWYVELNSNLFSASKSLILVPPSSFMQKNVTILGSNFSTSTDTYAVLHLPGVPLGYTYVFYVTAGLSAGVSPKNNQYRKIGLNSLTNSIITTLTPLYKNVFGALPPVGSYISWKVKIVNNANGASAWSFVRRDIVV